MENIILLHGALGSSHDLEPLSNELTQHGFRVFLCSFSGHGKIKFRTDFGIKGFSVELEHFIRDHRLKEPHVFGYSMGGYVALHLALNRPALQGKIITLGTKFAWSDDFVAREIKQLDAEIMIQKVPAFANMLKEKHGTEWKQLLKKTADMMKNIAADQALNNNTLKHIHTPTLLGLADRDQMVSVDETVDVLKTLPNASMYMLPSSKHQLESVNAKLLSAIITDFIARGDKRK